MPAYSVTYTQVSADFPPWFLLTCSADDVNSANVLRTPDLNVLEDCFFLCNPPDVFAAFLPGQVATSKSFLSSPMMLQFPVLNPGPSGRGFTILGLGDITVPGLLIALALRFDRFRNSSSNEGTGEASTSDREGGSGWEWLDSIDDKTYFRTCLAAYCVGLGVTFGENALDLWSLHLVLRNPKFRYAGDICVDTRGWWDTSC